MKGAGDSPQSKDVMILTTYGARQKLKVIAAATGTSMKGVLARLVDAEFKRLHEATNALEEKR